MAATGPTASQPTAGGGGATPPVTIMSRIFSPQRKANGDRVFSAQGYVAGVPTVTSVTVSPTTVTQASGTIQFTVTVNGTNSPSQATTPVITGGGSINGSNLYTLPPQTLTVQTVTITWTSVQDTTKSASATVYIPGTGSASDAPVIAIATIMRKSTVNLTAPLVGDINLIANLL